MYASIQLDESTLTKAWAEGREMSLAKLLAERVPGPSSSEPAEMQPGPLKANPVPTPQNSSKEEPLTSKQTKGATTSLYPAGLTRREVEVLRLLAAGLSNAEIGRELSLSTLTINTYLRTIYSKLEVSSRNAATRLAFDIGLI
jgi:ATP/maltotriose-dependent transcriptional regulator MalT